MTSVRTRRADRPVRGAVRVPGDKSISHRAALIASVAAGRSVVSGFAGAADCEATLSVLRTLGVRVERKGGAVTVTGRAGRPFVPPDAPCRCGRSGTTMRLVAGLVAPDPGPFVLTGEEQLLSRPMDRVADPLRMMGAVVETAPGGRPPLRVAGGELRGIEYSPPVASAQVKSAVLLAGLRASGATTVEEAIPTRDHTERLLAASGVRIDRSDGRATVWPGVPAAFRLAVPGDFSSAAFLIAGAALVPGSDLRIEGVGLNPTRTGLLDILARMGGRVEAEPESEDAGEPAGSVRTRHAPLGPVTIGPDEVPAVIDEVPLIALLSTQAQGESHVRGATELRVKESDRIAGLVAGLRAVGADIEELPDGFRVRGPTPLRGGSCDARTDHRLAMTFSLAGLIAGGPIEVTGAEFVADSFPTFQAALDSVR